MPLTMHSSLATGLQSLGGFITYPQMGAIGWYRQVTIPNCITLNSCIWGKLGRSPMSPSLVAVQKTHHIAIRLTPVRVHGPLSGSSPAGCTGAHTEGL